MTLTQAQLERIDFLIGKQDKDTTKPLPPIQNHGDAIFPSTDARDYQEFTEEEIKEAVEEHDRRMYVGS